MKKLLTVAGLVLCVFLATTSGVFAATAPTVGSDDEGGFRPAPTGKSELQKFDEAAADCISDGTPCAEQFIGVTSIKSLMGGLACEWTGCTNLSRVTGSVSAVNSLSRAVALLYTPQAKVDIYLADVAQNAGFGIVQPAQAQGLGFASLNPILEAWKIFRNLAYFFYIILFLGIGFMIMFRKQVGSQTAVTAQQALPKIVVSLLAVTFSYAIAGLLIDLMYLMMFLVVSIFQPQFSSMESPTLASKNLQDYALNNNIFSVGIEIFKMGVFNNSGDAVKEMVEAALSVQNDGTAGDGAKQLLGFIGGLTFAVTFSLALVFGIFRLFFELLKTYVSIVIAIVLSPLALMMGALPGNNAFQSWIKTLIANLMVFPAVLVIIILAFILGTNDWAESGGFLPPYLIGQGNANAVKALLGMGILLILPDIATQVKKALGGSGGIFEQFAQNFGSAVNKGWKGGELVPGLSFTDTSKYGLTGQNFAQKEAVVGGMLGGAAAGLGAGVISRVPGIDRVKYLNAVFRPRAMSKHIQGGAFASGRRVADAVDDKRLFNDDDGKYRKERQKGTRRYNDT